MNQNIISDRVKIYFCVPYCFVKLIEIIPNFKIGNLMKIFNAEGIYTYIYNGNIINSELTLNQIGISNGNIIVAIKKNANENNDEHLKWIKLSQNNLLEDKFKIITNKVSKHELYRLKDLKNYKVEGSLKIYRRFTRRMYLNNLKKKEEDQTKCNLKLNYEPLSAPCTEAMPILW